jgi:hypothetical protein
VGDGCGWTQPGVDGDDGVVVAVKRQWGGGDGGCSRRWWWLVFISPVYRTKNIHRTELG